jgi:type II secretory pathway pseudopilin PulG
MFYNDKHIGEKKRRKSAGFTMVEIAISMVIISSILGMGIVLIPRLAYQFQEKSTYQKIEYIHRAMSAYVQKYNRIPCPANPQRAAAVEPYGTERGSGANGQNLGACNTVATRQGIVPFRTLGLNYDDVHDSFGNLFTYRVSLDATATFNVAANDELNNWCRTQPKWHDGVTDLDVDKAAFCCGFLPAGVLPAPTDDTGVEGPFGPLPGSNRNIIDYGGAVAEYSQITDPVPTSADLEDTFRPSYAAYTLISHGANGLGHYNYLGTQDLAPLRYLSADELSNAAAGNITYVQDNTADTPNGADPGVGIKRPLSRREIDDIVSWRNPFQIYSEVGHASCTGAR